jgi:hypothetical protein
MATSNRHTIFKSCIRRNIDFERFLASSPTDFIIQATNKKKIFNTKTLKQFTTLVSSMPENSVKLLKVVEQHENHGNILVKSHTVPGGWSIFEPNSFEHAAYRIINEKGKDVAKKYFSVSPPESINYPSKESPNPGYCGIFSIIFMVYFRMHKDDKNWFKNWEQILENKLVHLDLAAEVQEIISEKGSNIDTEQKIQGLLNERLVVSSPGASTSQRIASQRIASQRIASQSKKRSASPGSASQRRETRGSTKRLRSSLMTPRSGGGGKKRTKHYRKNKKLI